MSRRRPSRPKPSSGAAAPVAAPPAPAPAAPGGLRRRPALTVAVLALVVWAPSLAGGFLYDDLRMVVENRAIRDLRALGVVVRSDPARPVLALLSAANHAVGGGEAWTFHLVNVLLHAGCAALAASLFAWVARLRPGDDRPWRVVVAGAWFAVTPMAAETVGYVTSRSSALAGLFGLAALRVAAPALEGAGARRVGAALGLLLLALASKEEAVAVPLLLLVLDAVYVARGDLRAVAARWRIHAPFLLLPLLGLLARRAVAGTWLPPAAHPRDVYLVSQLAAFPGYLARALVPLDPALYRGVPPVPWPPDVVSAALAALGVGLVAGAVAAGRRHPDAAFAVLWMAACLVPSAAVPLKEIVVDHRAYLGGAGLAWAVAGPLSQPLRLPFAACLLMVFAGRAVHAQRVLADDVRVWEDALRRAPHAEEAWFGLGEAYLARGDARAEAAFRHAVAAAPHDARTWSNLGRYYALQGRAAEAERALREAVGRAPRDSRLRSNLALVLLAQGKAEEGRGELEQAVVLEPPLAQARVDLARLLLEAGERERARALLHEAGRIGYDAALGREVVALEERLR